jgi:hypothetical protein
VKGPVVSGVGVVKGPVVPVVPSPADGPVRCPARTLAAPDARAACPQIGPGCPGGVPVSRGEDGAILPYGSPGGGGPCW